MEENERLARAARDILNRESPRLDPARPLALVDSILERRSLFLDAVERGGSPLYFLDRSALRRRAARFLRAFSDLAPEVRVFFALKSNHHPEIARTLVGAGLGLDVSSGGELEQALRVGAARIVFSGPGKTDSELERALRCGDRVTVLLDSFGELDRMQAIASRLDLRPEVGVRLTTGGGLWRKFGIPLADLAGFFARARAGHRISLRGLQFHTSWNLDPSAQLGFLQRLAPVLESLEPRDREALAFVDIGGGYWPEDGEWLLPGATPAGRLALALGGPDTGRPLHHLPAVEIEAFAAALAPALERTLRPVGRPAIWTEPGRWLCHGAMHLLLTVVDRKADDLVITDGGTNAIGWERFESDYFPVINLTRPAREEFDCLVLGSLCTPHDLWGRTVFGSDVRPGDTLLIPNQGAYTWSLRQEFIKPLPPVAWEETGVRCAGDPRK
jgi:diaminopimelate decarboxylase